MHGMHVPITKHTQAHTETHPDVLAELPDTIRQPNKAK